MEHGQVDLAIDNFTHGNMGSSSGFGNQFLRKRLRGTLLDLGSHV
jgi:hypothetical protein